MQKCKVTTIGLNIRELRKILEEIQEFTRQTGVLPLNTVTKRRKKEVWLVFKEGALESIKQAKGWKTDNELAKELGFTRAYISMLKCRKEPVSHHVMVAVACSLGNLGNNWGQHFYEMVKVGMIKNNTKKDNMEKFNCRKPYEKHSPSADFRRQDNKNVETK